MKTVGTYTRWNIIPDIKKEGNLPLATAWMDCEGIVLSDISHTERARIPWDLTRAV